MKAVSAREDCLGCSFPFTVEGFVALEREEGRHFLVIISAVQLHGHSRSGKNYPSQYTSWDFSTKHIVFTFSNFFPCSMERVSLPERAK